LFEATSLSRLVISLSMGTRIVNSGIYIAKQKVVVVNNINGV